MLLTFHLWKMDQVYSSPDGKAQFIELSDPVDGENHLAGHFISSNEKTFTFPTDLPSSSTANHHFLIGTTSYAALPGAVTPDYIVPDNFFNPAGDTLDYADVDAFSFTAGQVPTDGMNSVFRNVNTFSLSTGPNSETNLAGQTGSVSDVPKSGYLQLNLVSDQSGTALIQDPQLVNPWGVSQSATSPFWVSDNGTGVSTIYSGDVAGSPFSKSGLVVSITGGAPTGQVANSTTDFSVASGSASGPARFIFASENGSITGWNPSVPAAGSTQAVVGATTTGAVYKGIAMANNGTANQLYAANFDSGNIDVFSATFQPVTLAAGAFTDPNLPAGYAPFNIANIGGKLYVSYALQDAAKHDDVAGFGHGFVDVYDTSGTLLQRLITGTPGDPNSPLNSPWGMALAPANFGDLSGDLLVGNFGNGKINAFDPNTGAFKGTLTNATGTPIVIDGLWALQFGNGAGGGDAHTLYFSAGTGGEQHGLFGALINASSTPLSGDGTKIATTEGTSFTGTVAAFASSNTAATASAFTATIDWGDGTSSTGMVNANGDGGFNVTGSHLYTEEAASDTMHVTVSDGTNSVTLNASASVKDAPLTATGVPVSLQQGLTLSNVAVATFTDAGGPEPDANYTATIDWGDGTTSTGTVSGAGNTFTVTGSHTYAADGQHAISTAINDEGGATATATSSAQAGYLQVNLISDQPGAALIQDPQLVNPWGVSQSATSPFWVSDNGTGVSTIYSGDVAGSPFSKSGLVVSITGGAPTGQVANSTTDFSVASGSASGPARFIFASENGSITGWSPSVPAAGSTQSVVGASTANAVYKGIALANNGTANQLYAANFNSGNIDVFSATFQPVTLAAGAFADPNLPAGYAPFNIANIGGKLYVSYALQDAAKHDDVAGFGHGFVDVYDTSGMLLQRLITGTPGDPNSPLNSPWGMALAPANFGDLSGDLLVGNFGNGKINAFDPNTGAFKGTLTNATGAPIVIDGLWALQFGNGAGGGDANTLYFSAGTGGEQHGLFGALVNVQNTPLSGDGTKITTTEGTSFTGTVAAFASSDTAATASAFAANIDWGDGSTSTGTVVANGDGGFNVTGSHTYTEEAATETMHVTVSDGTNSVTLNASASVKDAPLTATGVPVSLQQGTTLSNVAVATFTDAGGPEPDANYTATIDWGDGTTSSGTVSGAGNTFTVTGSHTYAADGQHAISTAIKDEGGATATATSSAQAGYLQVNLVSDQAGTALIQDPQLVNPWGVSQSATSPFWVSDNGTGVSTIYSGDVAGSPFSKSGLVVSITGGAPTGQVANSTTDFSVASGSASGPARFIFASENGSITGWNPSVPAAGSTQAVVGATTTGAVYKGIALANNGTANQLYAANFNSGNIDVFSATFQPVTLATGAFTDPNLPAGYAPFNIANIGGKLYVSYALQDAAKHDDVAGFGHGFVDVYDTSGTLLQRLITGTPGDPNSPLNSPWGMALAPANFGDLSGDLLVGNFGNGKINAFDPSTGAFLGALTDAAGHPIVIDGLWALQFGNGTAGGDANTLYFSAGTGGEQHGLFGALINASSTPLSGDGTKIATTEGTSFTGTVAAFASSDTAATASAFAANIDWGDGSTSTGTVVANGDGGFNVTGSHTYTEEAATETMHVTVSDGTNSVTLNASASVKDAPLTATGVPVSLQQGLTLSNVAVATFTDAGGAEPDANYTATIDWGDGTTSSGTVSGAGNTFTVTGSHTYAADGQHAISTAIKDEGGATATATSSAQAGYLQVNLVSDQAGAALLTDPQLVNPWGLAFSPTSPFWISDNGADVATIYSGDVNGSAFGKAGLVVSVPGGAPTGQVANTTNDFVVHSGNASGPAKFIFASENGSITGWNPTVPAGSTQAQVGITVPGAVYKGLALANTGTVNELFATNFAAGTIDVFDSTFHPVTLPTGAFTDPNLPTGFAPFNIELINGKLFVTYAKQDAAKHDDVAGFGNGFIDEYTLDGTLAQRLVTGVPGDPTSPLNSPWGMALAPADFGDFSGDLLVGNFGNGKINAFDPNTGAFLGTVNDASGAPIVIDGLWALAFGNGAAAGSTNTLFFTAGTDGEQHGLFGALVNAQNTPLAGDGAKLSTTEGGAVSGTIATFSTTNVGALPSAFSSTITWGDGATSAGTIVPNGSGGFNVLGSHTFAEEGTEAVAIAIHDAADDNFTMNASVAVGDAPLTATGVPVNPAQGTAVSAATVATFTDAGGAEPVANYTATIDWGDGTSTTGTVSLSGSTFSVSGSHTYNASGDHTITTTIKDDGGATATATSSTLVLTGQGMSVSPTEGIAFTGALARFTSNDTSLAASDFSATIDWGDGTSSTGSVSGSAGTFSVLGTHTYSEEATETIHVTVAGNSGQSITIDSSLSVADAPLAATGANLKVARNDATAIALATFSDAGGAEPVANYTATIDWGDGSATSTGTISATGAGFSVSGSHAYQKPGRHTATVTISDEGGSTAVATSRVVVGSDHERLVQQFFEDLLHRDVDDGALSFFEGELNSGTPASAVVAQIEASTAYLANQVQTFFQQFLHRPAEAQAVSYFSSLMSTGSTPEHVEDIIVSSPEYFQLHGAADGNSFLNTLYQDGLGRGIDPQAQAFWDKLSLTDGSARAQIGAAVFASEEFLNDLVRRDFETLLGRPADAGALTAFVKTLKSGATDQQVLAAIMGSAEFAGNA